MRKTVLSLALIALAVPCLAWAEIGAIDQVPASTLLLPYFEVDLNNPSGGTTLFSVNNAKADPALALVTLWTDESIPTFSFNVYLTGYDVQTINLRDIFNGYLPVTADQDTDPNDTISPRGRLSRDARFPGSTGPCVTPYLYPAVSIAFLDHLRKSHVGESSPLYGGCVAHSYGDHLARGYVTVDSVVSCGPLFPSDAGFFTNTADNRNTLWGEFILLDPSRGLTLTAPLLHLEACSAPSVGNGAGLCPFSFAAGDYTFYGRYNAVGGQDQREPLATTFATRYNDGGPLATELIVWRDAKTRPAGANGPHACGRNPSWYPLGQYDVVSFDEQENPTNLCWPGDGSSPVGANDDVCFPLAAQRIDVSALRTPSPFGWLFLNLNHRLRAGDPYPGRAGAWVITVMESEGALGTLAGGLYATQLDNATSSLAGGQILIP